MSNPTFDYPFDPTGTRATNRIVAEHQTITPHELSEHHFIIPGAAPYFQESLVVVHLPTQRTLVEGVDYQCTHYFFEASLSTAKPIYGSITFMDKELTGAVRMSYQTVGGAWTLTSAKIIEILSNRLLNPRRISWEQVANIPYQFPPTDHDHHVRDMTGMKEVTVVLEAIREAIFQSGEGGLQTHLADKNNPHGTDKQQVGLGEVQNYPVASIAEAREGLANNRYLTVLRGAQMLEALVGTAFNAHVNNSNNPHNTTKAHVGLSAVENYGPASQSEAEGGAANNKVLTPLRGKQLVDALVMVPLNAHINNTNNPHNTNKGHVGLGNVPNYPMADAVTARAGASTEHFMSPSTTRELITVLALQGLSSHVDNQNNPHNTNKQHVGLGSVENYGPATQAEAEDALANNKVLTPLRGRQLVTALVGTAFNAHINNSDNPHGTTKSHVGLSNVDNFATANDAQAQAGAANNLFITVRGAALLFAALGGGGGGDGGPGLTNHLNDLENPHETTKQQVGLGNVDNFATATTAEGVAGLAPDKFVTVKVLADVLQTNVLQTLNSHINLPGNPHNTTAGDVGAYTTAQVDTRLSGKLDTTAKAADSDKLDGKTFAQIQSAVSPVLVVPAERSINGPSWTQIGEMFLPADQFAAPLSEIVADLSGADAFFFNASSSFELRLTPRNIALSSLHVKTENYPRDVRFGYTNVVETDGTRLKLFVAGSINRQPLSISPQSGSPTFFQIDQSATATEPADIVYLTPQFPAFARPRAFFGDLNFGDLPRNQGAAQSVGGMVEWMSVATTDAEELECQAVENSLKEDYANFLPSSPSGALFNYGDLAILDSWSWDDTAQAIVMDAASVPGSVQLIGDEPQLNYTLEVELSSSDVKAMGAGVVAASFPLNGRQMVLSVLRTPGGLSKLDNSPMDFRYKLLNVQVHAGQRDTLNIEGRDGTLQWGDGMVNDDRDPTTFTDAGNGWDEAGAVRLRVVRAGNIITIDTTQFGGTTYVAAEQIVLDLEADPALAMFVDQPTNWGLISVQQPKVSFKVLQRPARYRSYVRIGKAGDLDKQRLYRFIDGAWTFTYLGINNVLVRPNRFYFSDWNGVLYQAQRNGRLRPMMIEAFMRDGSSVMGP